LTGGVAEIRLLPFLIKENMRRAPAMNPFRGASEGQSGEDRPEWNINPSTGFTWPTLAAGS